MATGSLRILPVRSSFVDKTVFEIVASRFEYWIGSTLVRVSLYMERSVDFVDRTVVARMVVDCVFVRNHNLD
jgi:hypothetical protein